MTKDTSILQRFSKHTALPTCTTNLACTTCRYQIQSLSRCSRTSCWSGAHSSETFHCAALSKPCTVTTCSAPTPSYFWYTTCTSLCHGIEKRSTNELTYRGNLRAELNSLTADVKLENSFLVGQLVHEHFAIMADQQSSLTLADRLSSGPCRINGRWLTSMYLPTRTLLLRYDYSLEHQEPTDGDRISARSGQDGF